MWIAVVLNQQKNGLSSLPLVQPGERVAEHLAVEGLHPLAGEHPGVLDLLLADAAEDGILAGIVLVGDPRMEHAARSVLLQVFGVLLTGVVELFGLLFGVQVIEVPEPLVEPVHVGRNSLRSPRWFLPNWPVA